MKHNIAKTVRVELGERSYDIVIGRDILPGALPPAGDKKRLFVFDDKTFELYAGKFAGENDFCFSFGRGEEDKRFDKMISICQAAVGYHLDRKCVMAAVGGGVTGDMTGFASAIYLRGINFIQVPTSLLAMVDSSVGGKTAVDLPEGKNLVGVFHQPSAVIIDTAFLETLPAKELHCGIAEVIKMAAGFDENFFVRLESMPDKLADTEHFQPVAAEIICRSCELKADVVRRDEKESVAGVREMLNFGHTFGHAVETLSDFSLSHGECVAIGMVIAGEAAMMRRMWSAAEQTRLIALLKAAGLPVSVPEGMSFDNILELMRRDKKNRDGRITLILPRRIGELCVVRDFSDVELETAWDRAKAGSL